MKQTQHQEYAGSVQVGGLQNKYMKMFLEIIGIIWILTIITLGTRICIKIIMLKTLIK